MFAWYHWYGGVKDEELTAVEGKWDSPCGGDEELHVRHRRRSVGFHVFIDTYRALLLIPATGLSCFLIHHILRKRQLRRGEPCRWVRTGFSGLEVAKRERGPWRVRLLRTVDGRDPSMRTTERFTSTAEYAG